MDSLDVVSLARELIDIDSTTGREGELARRLAARLRRLGYSVEEQPVDCERFNVFAVVQEPVLVFSTHLDCVPPFFPSRIEGGLLYGRGACDAKGILAAQVVAAERLRARGESRVGLLFLAGEERGSDGARAANRIQTTSLYLVNGEPTENRLARATRGALRVTLTTSGRAAHSGYPELGHSAIDALVDLLVDLRSVEWPSDPVLGRTHFTVGLIRGGVAPNVVPPHAEAEILFRTVGSHDAVRAALAAVVGERARVTEVIDVPPVWLETVEGFETAVFSYTTDIPFLSNWGKPLLLGPGSIHVAHTDEERVRIEDLHVAVDCYIAVAQRLLSRVGNPG